MKKIMISAFVVIVALCTTSCVKDWTCVCTSSSGTVNEVYKNTKLATAIDKCDDREANWRIINPATNCSIK